MIVPIGSVQHADDDAIYYGGVQNETGETFGVYQYVTFTEPNTQLTMVGKPHSFWFCKHSNEYQMEVQPLTFVPKALRLPVEDPQLIELDLQTSTVELPAAMLQRRIRTNVVYVPPSVETKAIAAYVRNAELDYTDAALGLDDDEEEDEEGVSTEEEDADAERANWFFYKYMRDSANAQHTRELALPPKFNDGWLSFCSQWPSFESDEHAPYWKHEFAAYVLTTFLHPVLQRLAPSLSPSQTFYAMETGACSLKTVAAVEVVDGSKRKVRRPHVRWFPKSQYVQLDDQLYNDVLEFLNNMKRAASEQADAGTVYKWCTEIVKLGQTV